MNCQRRRSGPSFEVDAAPTPIRDGPEASPKQTGASRGRARDKPGTSRGEDCGAFRRHAPDECFRRHAPDECFRRHAPDECFRRHTPDDPDDPLPRHRPPRRRHRPATRREWTWMRPVRLDSLRIVLPTRAGGTCAAQTGVHSEAQG